MAKKERVTITIDKNVIKAMRHKKIKTGIGVATQINMTFKEKMKAENYLKEEQV